MSKKPSSEKQKDARSSQSDVKKTKGKKNQKSKKRKQERLVSGGDTSRTSDPKIVESFEVNESVEAARESKIVAVTDIVANTPPHDLHTLAQTLEAIIERASPDDATILRKALLKKAAPTSSRIGPTPDELLSSDWRDGGYPYRNLMSRKSYEKEKHRLPVELLKLQAWVRERQKKLVILFEGRDAAGKGGTIKRFMEHLNPRGVRVVALEKPTESESGQWYYQRYVEHFTDRRGNHDVRPFLVQPSGVRKGDGFLYQ